MSDVLAYAIAVLFLAQALLRAPSAVRGRVRKRSLWGAFAALAAAWLARTSTAHEVLASFGIADLAYLVKHVLAITGICVLLRYVTAVYSTAGPAERASRTVRISSLAHRVATRASLGTIAVMVGVFFLALDEVVADVLYFTGRYAGEPGLAVYMGLFYLYMGTAAAVCAVQWGGAVRQIPQRAVRVGMVMMSGAMILAVVYALLRTAYVLLITITPVSDDFSLAQEAVTDTLLYVAGLLWGIGALAPASRAARTRARALSDLFGLHPLWRDLAVIAPHRIRQRPRTLLQRVPGMAYVNMLRDVFSYYDETPDARVQRFVTEIRDVMLELSRHAPAGLTELALAERDSPGGAAGEALWIRAAQAAYQTRPESALASLPFAAGATLAAEVPHFRAVTEAYCKLTAEHGWQVLRAATSSSDQLTQVKS
ncbi:MAB_1171c family putative transporter [Streptomyces anulatus]|uniref:MAB_1171c family putative transporter n=1 Tax=Streptomyces anulatus TaxID=1892 RepID=UPI001C25336B|nr:MAB_1171c family putative transporter [Streptomyces anulatus]